MVSVKDAIYNRRSIRKYEERPVERELLEELVRQAAAAPSAQNQLPWEFLVITEEEILKGIRENVQYAAMKAPALIVILANQNKFRNPDDTSKWIQDCGAAMENILLGALDMGLGTVWLGIHGSPEKEVYYKKVLQLPDYIIPFGAACVGYPAEEKEPRTQFEEETLYWNQYGCRS